MMTKPLGLWTARIALPVLIAGAPVMAWVHHYGEQARFVQSVATTGADDALVVASPQDLGLTAQEPQAAATEVIVEAQQPEVVLDEPLVEEALLADAGEAALEPQPLEEAVVEDAALVEGEPLLADASSTGGQAGSFLQDSLLYQDEEGAGGIFSSPLGIAAVTAGAIGAGVGGYYISEELDEERTSD